MPNHDRGMAQDEISLVQLYAGQKVIESKIDTIKETQEKVQNNVELKHKENRKSIHDVREDLQDMGDLLGEKLVKASTHFESEITKVNTEVWKLKVKFAGYSAGGGALAAIAGHFIDKWLKHISQ